MNYLCGVGFSSITPEVIRAQSHFEAMLRYYTLHPEVELYEDTVIPSLYLYAILEEEEEFSYICHTEKMLRSEIISLGR